MAMVELNDNEWQAVMAMIALAPWRDANPLLMKIGQQLQAQSVGQQQVAAEAKPTTIKPTATRPVGDGKEIRQ